MGKFTPRGDVGKFGDVRGVFDGHDLGEGGAVGIHRIQTRDTGRPRTARNGLVRNCRVAEIVCESPAQGLGQGSVFLAPPPRPEPLPELRAFASCALTSPLLGVCPIEVWTYVLQNTCSRMFIAALFLIAPTAKYSTMHQQ